MSKIQLSNFYISLAKKLDCRILKINKYMFNLYCFRTTMNKDGIKQNSNVQKRSTNFLGQSINTVADLPYFPFLKVRSKFKYL